jgi:hypothetical protein
VHTADGKVKIEETADPSGKTWGKRGAIAGGVVGLIFPPSMIAGALVGGAGGGIWGKFRDTGLLRMSPRFGRGTWSTHTAASTAPPSYKATVPPRDSGSETRCRVAPLAELASEPTGHRDHQGNAAICREEARRRSSSVRRIDRTSPPFARPRRPFVRSCTFFRAARRARSDRLAQLLLHVPAQRRLDDLAPEGLDALDQLVA